MDSSFNFRSSYFYPENISTLPTEVMLPECDLSISITPSEALQFSEARNKVFSDTDFSQSVLENSKLMQDTDSTRSRNIYFERKNPASKERVDRLFSQFLQVLKGGTNIDAFQNIQNLAELCSKALDEVKIFNSRTCNEAGAEEMQWLAQECNTWKLLHALYKDRILLQSDQIGEIMPLGCSEKEVINHLYSYNAPIREYQMIVDWLEACYTPTDAVQLGHSTDRTVAWGNTLFQLQNPDGAVFGNEGEIVQFLDPDAPVREKKPLHPLDEEDDLRLAKCILTEIRQGRIDEAMALCKYCGQTWRAAILEGWRLHEDPNYESTNTNEKLPIEGNPRRNIWKKCAWLMADNNKFDQYNRAIAAALCGHLNSLKAVMNKSWLDLLWVYLKVQIDIRVESELQSLMPEEYWENKMTLEQIFNEISVHNNERIRLEAASKMHIIHKHIILDSASELLHEMHSWIEQEKLSPHMLRFLCHIVFFLREIGKADKEDVADEIVKAYVEALMDQNNVELVAFYTAALPERMQIVVYSSYLYTIKDTEERAAALRYGLEVGLDIETITTRTVERIRQQITEPQASNENLRSGEISKQDQEKIKALEWLTFYPEQRGELLWQANAMLRTFLADGKMDCVRGAFNMVPEDTILHLTALYNDPDKFPYREVCSVKEYLSFKVYIVALDNFKDWGLLLHQKPQKQSPVHNRANFTARVLSEHKEHMYSSELECWLINMEKLSVVTKDSLFNILLFPERGWLIDPPIQESFNQEDFPEWENRLHQLQNLRSICIPEVVLILHRVLDETEDHKGIMKLADEIANENRGLYRVYTKHKLGELLSKLADSCLMLLNSNLDPWGYPLAS